MLAEDARFLKCLLPERSRGMFDSSIGASTVMMYGGKYQQTETRLMVAKLPVLEERCCDHDELRL